MGQNNDNTEHGDLQGHQGAPKGKPKSAYIRMPDREGSNPFRGGPTPDSASLRPANAAGEDAPNVIPLAGGKG
ncbi:MAG: hypothetical protein JSR55_04945 [Proteobacteria bacterium]|nr:hypothetical protein [Pseudomonadota bacterium]